MKTLTEEQIAERYAGRFEVVDDCWVYTRGERVLGGYIRVYGPRIQGRQERYLIHRRALELALGRPLQAYALHKCDNPPCFRPSHLYEGTAQQNMDDRSSRGRTAVGERASKAKLTAKQVQQLRADRTAGLSYRKLAAKYGIHHSAARSIVLRKNWRSV